MHDIIVIFNNEIEKHNKYKEQYKLNDIYWGLGIENELYLEFSNKKKITVDFFFKHLKRERYSVDYFNNYKSEYLQDALSNTYKLMGDNILHCPILLNANSFVKTDMNNNSRTLYTKKCEDNPKFNGKTLIESLQDKNDYFIKTINNKWLFDGDTVEFATEYFYNTTLQTIYNELIDNKNEFIKNLNISFNELQIFNEHGNIDFMKHNHPFAIYMTNINNMSMFNNGTLHYNITLPSYLDEYGYIKYKKNFINDHVKAIKIIQWLEPIIIAVYGSPDPFSTLQDYENKHKFSASSQRCAVSRYIGIGTFDTDIMKSGKILTMPIEDLTCNNSDWWYNRFYEDNAYNKLKEIGLDINFNKHYNHGIEIRFLDHITDDKQILESFEFIIYLMDVIMNDDNINNLPNPIKNKLWNDITYNVIIYGMDFNLTLEQINIYQQIFNFEIYNTNIVKIYYEIYFKLLLTHNSILYDNQYIIITPSGHFSSLTLHQQKIHTNLLYNYLDKNYVDNLINMNINYTNDVNNIDVHINIDNNNINTCSSCCIIS